MLLKINSDSLVNFTYSLSKMHRAALPNAVRFTLTDIAKDVKIRTLQKHSNRQFDVSKPTFFKRYSGYEPAKGFDIKTMSSKAGMIKGNPPNAKSRATTDIGEQQHAGNVKNKSYIPAKNMRTAKGLVKSSYIKEINKKPIVVKSSERGRDFIEAAIKAKDEQRPLLVKKNNKGVLRKVSRVAKKGQFPVKSTIIAIKYSIRISKNNLRTSGAFMGSKNWFGNAIFTS